MSDAAYTARPTNKAMANERVQKITLEKDETGQYQHDAAVKYIELIKRELRGMFNLLDRQNGMFLLGDKTTNKINSIKSTDAYDATDILRQSKQKAEKESRSLGAVVTPDITARSDAQEEADRRNQYSQAVVGVKEGVTDAIIAAVGTDVTDLVLRDADGNSHKSVDDYKLHELFEAIIDGANRPKAPDVLAQFLDVASMQFDFRKKIGTNVETLKAKAAKVQSYGIKIDTAILVLTIFANIERAVPHEYGREFRPAMQAIRKKYNYDYQHDDASLTDILQELAAADSVRILKEAPEPEIGSAHAVDEQMTLLQQMMQQASIPPTTDYEEAMAAQSDSESSADTKRRSRSKSRNSRGGGRRGQSRGRGGGNRPKNKCKHCKRMAPYARKHPENKCHWNKDWKGYRPKHICDELELKFKPRIKFSSEMGGYPSDSESASE